MMTSILGETEVKVMAIPMVIKGIQPLGIAQEKIQLIEIQLQKIQPSTMTHAAIEKKAILMILELEII